MSIATVEIIFLHLRRLETYLRNTMTVVNTLGDFSFFIKNNFKQKTDFRFRLKIFVKSKLNSKLLFDIFKF